MKVFLSWSGEISREVSCIFRDWLPSVLQFIDPYVSSEDIEKGARWSTDIAEELDQSSYGVLMITRENINAPWVVFEAGALSKAIDKARVSPFLFNMKRSDLERGPLLQFQSTIFTKDEVLKLIRSINGAADEAERLEEARLEKVFEVWWPELESELNALTESAVAEGEKQLATSKISEDAVLEELLELAREQQRILNDPERLFPVRYLRYAMGEIGPATPIPPSVWRRLGSLIDEFVELNETIFAEDSLALKASKAIRLKKLTLELREIYSYINERVHLSSNRIASAIDRAEAGFAIIK
jgi:hypothetical protein